jgi:organic hydroperoxide reductase OsmC/OhrA
VTDPEQAVHVLKAAHKTCPYSQATRGNIPVTITVNGQSVD